MFLYQVSRENIPADEPVRGDRRIGAIAGLLRANQTFCLRQSRIRYAARLRRNNTALRHTRDLPLGQGGASHRHKAARWHTAEHSEKQ